MYSGSYNFINRMDYFNITEILFSVDTFSLNKKDVSITKIKMKENNKSKRYKMNHFVIL